MVITTYLCQHRNIRLKYLQNTLKGRLYHCDVIKYGHSYKESSYLDTS